MADKTLAEWFGDTMDDEILDIMNGTQKRKEPHKSTQMDIERERAAGSAFSSFCY